MIKSEFYNELKEQAAKSLLEKEEERIAIRKEKYLRAVEAFPNEFKDAIEMIDEELRKCSSRGRFECYFDFTNRYDLKEDIHRGLLYKKMNFDSFDDYSKFLYAVETYYENQGFSVVSNTQAMSLVEIRIKFKD